jgi:hypothetical protein
VPDVPGWDPSYRRLSPLGQALLGSNPSRDARLLMLAIGARARAKTLLRSRSPLHRLRYRPRHSVRSCEGQA